MILSDLVKDIPSLIKIIGDADVDIKNLVVDSRLAQASGLFFCIPGIKLDAHTFAPQAIKNGAVAVVVERQLDITTTQVVVSDVRVAMAEIASAFYGNPAKKLRLVGVTGTKGKSTTCYLVKSICEAAGYKVGLLGTIATMIGDKCLPAGLTTPDPIDLQRIFRQMVDEGVDIVTMEVSAHALALRKLEGIVYDSVVFTNLSHDHLDFFGSYSKYAASKKLLFSEKMCKAAAVNRDDEHSHMMIDGTTVPCMTYGIRELADMHARDIEINEKGVSFRLVFNKKFELQINLKLSGIFNVYNSMSAAAACTALGITPYAIKIGLESITNVPGRMEVLNTNTSYQMILDYAHSPDSLENILTAVRQFTRGKLIAVFGCGGDRDVEKRPVMGEIGGRLSDFVILTSDNPRSEDPMVILGEIEDGIKDTACEYIVIEKRREAIRHAMNMAKTGDVIVLAGKGHENYQEIKGVKYPFDEKVVVQELLQEFKEAT